VCILVIFGLLRGVLEGRCGRGLWEGRWVQVSNYNVCMSCRWWGGGSAQCAVEGWVGDCGGGVESIFFLLA